MKTVLSPKVNRWATVQVRECVFEHVCVLLRLHLNTAVNWPTSLQHMCMDVGDYFTPSSSTACKHLILYLSAVYMYVCVCTLLGDFGG